MTNITQLIISFMKDRRVYIGILILLGIAALISILQGINNALLYSQDFQWSPAVIFWDHDDPYYEFLTGNQTGKIILSQSPNYLHFFYILLQPLAQLDFQIAKISWVLLNIILSISCLFVLKRYTILSWHSFFFMSFIFLSSMPFRNTLGNGQSSIFVLFFISIYWFSNSILKGVWLAIGVIKYSFAPVFIFLALLKREKSLIVLAFFLTASILFFSFQTNQSVSIKIIIEPLLVASKATSPGVSDLMSLMRYNLGLDFYYSITVCIFLALSVAFLLRKSNPDSLSLAVLCISSLLFFQHLGYDYVFLLPVLSVLLERFFLFTWQSRILLSITIFFFFFYIKIDKEIFKLLTDNSIRVVGAILLTISLVILLTESYKNHE